MDNRVSKKGSFKIYYKIISLTRRFVGSKELVWLEVIFSFFFLLRNRNLFTSLQYDWIWKAPQFLQKCQKNAATNPYIFLKSKCFVLISTILIIVYIHYSVFLQLDKTLYLVCLLSHIIKYLKYLKLPIYLHLCILDITGNMIKRTADCHQNGV